MSGYPTTQPYSRAGLLAKLTGAATLAAGALLYGNATSQLQTLALGTAGRVLVAGASAPAWSDSGLSYASGVLTVAGSVPGTPSSGQVLVGGGAVKAGGGVSGTTLTARPVSGQDGLVIQGRATGSSGYNLTLTTVAALSADATVYLPTVNGATVMATTNSPVAGQIPFSAGTNYAMTLAGTLSFDSALLTLFVGLSTSTQNPILHLAAGGSGSGVAKVKLGTNVREWELKAGASPYNFSIDYVGTDAPLPNILSLTKAGAATFIGTVTFPNGTESAPGLRVAGEASGLYRHNATTLGFSAAGTRILQVTKPNGSTIGTVFLLNTPTAAQYGFIGTVATDTHLALTGSSTDSVRGVIRLYGSSHATKPGYIEFGGATVSAFFDGSGNLGLGDGSGSPTFGLLGAAGTNRAIAGYSGSFANANRRWLLYFGNSDAEAGANAGSNIALLARDDAGNGIDTVLKIYRVAGGNVEIYRPLYCTGTVTFPNGTAGAPGIRVAGEASGFYRASSTAIGTSIAGVGVSTLQVSTSTTFRTGLFLFASDSVQPVWIAPGANTDSILIGGAQASGVGAGGQVRLYGSTHASKPDTVELTHGSTVKFAANATGIGFFGAAPVARPSLAAATGTATRTTFDTATVTLPQLAERVKALIDDWRGYGLGS